jgi:hypothetical protein
MPYSFPLSLAEFWDILPIERISFDAPAQLEINETAGGDAMTADLAPRLWMGEIRFGDMLQHEAALPETRLDLAQSSGATFYAYDRRRPGPLTDPNGTILGASVPTIHTLVANNIELRLQGLPVGYKLSLGDYLAFNYGTAPVRRALHRIISDPSAVPAGGVSPVFQVMPPIRPGAVTGAVVTLVKASCKAIIIPKSVAKGDTRQTVTRNMQFRFKQTLR